MNFPMDNPLFQFFYWIVNTSGLGGIAAILVAGGSLTAYALTLRWIAAGAQVEPNETYAYPTPGLFEHGGDQG